MIRRYIKAAALHREDKLKIVFLVDRCKLQWNQKLIKKSRLVVFGIPLLIAGGSSQTAERRGTAEETNPRWEEKRHNHNEKTLIDKERTTMKKQPQ